MGSCLSCLALDALCCVGSRLCRCCCCVIPWKKSTASKIWYTLTFILWTLIAWALSHWGDKIPKAVSDSCNGDCFKYFAVDRISLSLVMYHSILCVLLLGAGTVWRWRRKLHTSFWPLKLLILMAFTVACFYFDVMTFKGYFIASYMFSAIFILLQSFILVDFAWNWAQSWIDKWEEEDNELYKYLLVIFTSASYICCLIFSILLYVYYCTKSGCGINVAFVTINLILVILQSIVSIHPKVQENNPRSGIFQSSIMGLYTTYLVGSAISSEPNDDSFSCTYALPGSNTSLSKGVLYSGIVIAFLTLGYSALNTGSTSATMFKSDKNDLEMDNADDDDEDDNQATFDLSIFHFVFVLASFYACAVLTNWAMTFSDINSTNTLSFGQGMPATWIKIATGWLCNVLYVWTMVAPSMFPDRDFS